jgi:hypothetical protein
MIPEGMDLSVQGSGITPEPLLPIPGHHRRHEAKDLIQQTLPSRHSDGRFPPDLEALSWTVPVLESAGSSFHERVISLRQRYNRLINHDSQYNEDIRDAA